MSARAYLSVVHGRHRDYLPCCCHTPWVWTGHTACCQYLCFSTRALSDTQRSFNRSRHANALLSPSFALPGRCRFLLSKTAGDKSPARIRACRAKSRAPVCCHIICPRRLNIPQNREISVSLFRAFSRPPARLSGSVVTTFPCLPRCKGS